MWGKGKKDAPGLPGQFLLNRIFGGSRTMPPRARSRSNTQVVTSKASKEPMDNDPPYQGKDRRFTSPAALLSLLIEEENTQEGSLLSGGTSPSAAQLQRMVRPPA